MRQRDREIERYIDTEIYRYIDRETDSETVRAEFCESWSFWAVVFVYFAGKI